MKKTTLLLILALIFLFNMINVNADIKIISQVQDIYNINEKIPLQISLSYKDEIQGYIKANINCDNKSLDYYVTPFNFKNNEQQLSIPELTLTQNMIGKCNLNILLFDLNNDLIDQELIKAIGVSDKLNLNAFLENSQIDPGKSLVIKGSVKNIRNLDLKDVSLTIALDDKDYNFNLNTPDFNKEILTDQKIKSGEHKVNVKTSDKYNNNAEAVLSFNIIPKPIDLKNLMNKLEFLPGDSLEVSSLLYDQANDLIDNNAPIKIYDSKNNYITQGYKKLIYVLPQNSPPGTWTIRTSDSGFNIESKFVVKELKQVDLYFEGGFLYIKNLGNVNYQDDIKVNIVNVTEFIKKVDVGVNGIEKIDLSKKVDPGEYDVEVQSSSEEKKFSQVYIPRSKDVLYLTGETIKDTSNNLVSKPYLFAAIIALILVTAYLFNKNKRLQTMRREKEIQQGYMSSQRIKKEKEVSGFKPKKFADLSNEELSDYRKQILKNMKDDKKEDENQGYQYKPPKEGKGLFSMFD